MSDMSDDCELIVVGGGPGGAALATFVAMQGHRVILLEKEKFPRYQVGESLLPATIHGICPLLGVSEEVRSAKFMRKLGGTFRWGRNPEPWTFSFAMSPTMPGPTGFAYQVERSRFDWILLENARRRGVEVREQAQVTAVTVEDARVSGVSVVEQSGREYQLKGRYVADSSGNTSRIYKAVADRVYSKLFRNVALYGYYEGGERLPSPAEGNALAVAFEGGWLWYIPLSATLTSVGAVVDREHARHIRGREEE